MERELTYIKGFNAGYKMNEYTPELWEKLKPSLSLEVEYERGLVEGAMEFEKTKIVDRTKELGGLSEEKVSDKSRETELKNLRDENNQTKDLDLER